MTVHTILQAVCLFIIYTVLTVVLPELVFHQKYKGRRTGERLMLDITVSNFYIMNLVFILQLLHISSIYTLLILRLCLSLPSLLFSTGKHLRHGESGSLHSLEKFPLKRWA